MNTYELKISELREIIKNLEKENTYLKYRLHNLIDDKLVISAQDLESCLSKTITSMNDRFIPIVKYSNNGEYQRGAYIDIRTIYDIRKECENSPTKNDCSSLNGYCEDAKVIVIS